MQLKDIQNIKTITIPLVFINNQSTLNYSFFVEFIPDYVIVKNVSIYDFNNQNADSTYIVDSSLISDNTSLFNYCKSNKLPIYDSTTNAIVYEFQLFHFKQLKPENVFKMNK